MQTQHKMLAWQCVRHSYVVVFGRIGTLLQISWLWLLVMAPIAFLFGAIFLPWVNRQFNLIQTDLHPVEATLLALGMSAMILYKLPCFSSISVAWHRSLLLNEPVGPRPYFRLDRVVWSYFDKLAIITMLYSIPLIILTSAIIFQNDPTLLESFSIMIIEWSVWVGLIVCFSVAAVLSVKISLVLPSTAVQDEQGRFSQAWRVSRGNTIKLIFGLVACTAPIQGIEEIISIYFVPNGMIMGGFEGVIYFGLDSLSQFIATGFLSFAYQQLSRLK